MEEEPKKDECRDYEQNEMPHGVPGLAFDES